MVARNRKAPNKKVDRAAELREADSLKSRGKIQKAIAAYRRILEATPDDGAVHGKLAPLLLEAGELGAASTSFAKAADAQAEAGFVDRAIGLYRQAAKVKPERVELWRRMAELKRERGLQREAVALLLEGVAHLVKGKKSAVNLLIDAHRLVPDDVAIAGSLAAELKRAGRKDEAVRLLSGLGERLAGGERRKARRALFRLQPSIANALAWLRA